MFCFQRFAVQPFLRNALPRDDAITGSADLIVTQHLFQQVFRVLLFLGSEVQLLASGVILL